jgi:thioredoxin-dependent peroxiredoxin
MPGVRQVFIKPDSEEDAKKWASSLPATGSFPLSIYRDPDAQLAKQFEIPDGYQFHGQTVHYPALVLLDPNGKEVFRYVGKSNRDRFGVTQLQQKIAELKKP